LQSIGYGRYYLAQYQVIESFSHSDYGIINEISRVADDFRGPMPSLEPGLLPENGCSDFRKKIACFVDNRYVKDIFMV